MEKHGVRIPQAAVLALLLSLTATTSSQAETGAVRVVFTKGGFIVGVGGGRGVLTFRGHRYPFRVSGMSLGATIGASTTDFVGRALNMRSPGDIAGNYGAVGVELSAAVGGVQIALE
jgi:hypothetical protein